MRAPKKPNLKEAEDFINQAAESPEDKSQIVASEPKVELGTVPESQPKQVPPIPAERKSSKKEYLTLISLGLPKPLLERLKDEAWRNRKSQSQFLRDLIDKNCK